MIMGHRRCSVLAAAICVTGIAIGSATSLAAEELPDQPACQTLGTRIEWTTGGLDAAAQKARDESKLLLVMHISGNFAKSAFT